MMAWVTAYMVEDRGVNINLMRVYWAPAGEIGKEELDLTEILGNSFSLFLSHTLEP
jgi:hypothetical protein